MLALELLHHNSQPINLVRQPIDSSTVITNNHFYEPLSRYTHSFKNVRKPFQSEQKIRASVSTEKSYNTQMGSCILVEFSKIENPVIVYGGVLKK